MCWMEIQILCIKLDGSVSYLVIKLTHCGRVTQICVFNTAKLGTSASSP